MEKQMLQIILGKILEQGPLITLMVIITWVLWNKLDEAEKYERERSRQVIEALNNSSHAMQENSRVIDKNTIVIDRLARSN